MGVQGAPLGVPADSGRGFHLPPWGAGSPSSSAPMFCNVGTSRRLPVLRALFAPATLSFAVEAGSAPGHWWLASLLCRGPWKAPPCSVPSVAEATIWKTALCSRGHRRPAPFSPFTRITIVKDFESQISWLRLWGPRAFFWLLGFARSVWG